LFLLPTELGFLKYLKQARVPLNEYEFPLSRIANVQVQLEHLVEKNYYLHRSARDAYRSYLQAYASHGLKSIFDVNTLDLQQVSKSFGFSVPPRVDLNFHAPKPVKRRGGGGGYGGTPGEGSSSGRLHKPHGLFSATNAKGARERGDKRQFSY